MNFMMQDLLGTLLAFALFPLVLIRLRLDVRSF